MNKKMREIKAKIEVLNDEANELLEQKKLDEAERKIGEIENLEREYVIAEKLAKNEKETITEEDIKKSLENKKASGFKAIAKMLAGRKLDEVEDQIILPAEEAADESGINYIIPEDVRTEINELKRSYKSAKEIVNVMPVSTLSGSTNYETEDNGELEDFDDGADIPEETESPKIKAVKWTIKWKGKLIYISNIILGNEKAQLMKYLDKWFARKAVRSENKAIFTALKAGKTATEVTGLRALKKRINLLDEALKVNGVIVTNSSGFAEMDDETDENGRPMLQPNPANATEKMFQSLPIKVYSDAEFPNVAEGKYPVLIGDTKSGADFYDRETYNFGVSEHFRFNKNQTTLRVIEGFDVQQTDGKAYEYISYLPNVKVSNPTA